MPAWTWLVTVILLVLGTGVWIGWDIYVATNQIPGDTISEIVLHWTRRYPTVILLIGYLMGHLLWPQYVKDDPKPKAQVEQEVPDESKE